MAGILLLPYELISRIATVYLEEIPRKPLNLLGVNSLFRDVGQGILHENLRFNSRPQMTLFQNATKLNCNPRTLTIELAGGASDRTIFESLLALLRHIITITPKGSPRLMLQRTKLRLNSYMLDLKPGYIYQALTLLDPCEFIWTGPDPAHHFSIAIVPQAAVNLFGALQTWNTIRLLKLTNIAFPTDEMGLFARSLGVSHDIISLFKPPPGSPDAGGGRFEYGDPSQRADTDSGSNSVRSLTSSSSYTPLPNLETIYIGQVTFLRPTEVAMIAIETRLRALVRVRVVDGYGGNIWGPRVRISDIEAAVKSAFRRTDGSELIPGYLRVENCLERVRSLVVCEALTERIMGGDRMDITIN